ncbi:MAG: hypothetical protein U5K76_04895 [Woeseiaceae bacterium]|nr:hypothetical protein [Woeseiaceae bacterium]
MIRDAGYAGVCLDPSVPEIDDTRALKPLFERFELKCILNVFPDTVDESRPLLDLSREMDACLVNIIGGVMPVAVEDASARGRTVDRHGQRVRLPVLFETHRDSLLNDLYFTLQLMERVPAMRLCADLSHFVVDREMRLPVRAADAAYIATILDRAECFQGRIANREQVQVQIEFPQHRPWVDQFRAWWLDGMQRWRERSAADATLVFLCELGPPPYAITDRDGLELSDRWHEAAQIRRWAMQAWDDADPAKIKESRND